MHPSPHNTTSLFTPLPLNILSARLSDRLLTSITALSTYLNFIMLFQLQDLELALEQPQIKCLDLATHFVGRKHSHGPVSIVESLSLGKKHQLAHLDLGYDQRLDGVDCKFNYTVKEIDCPDGAIKSFHPFMLQIKGVGQFVLFTKLLLELKKQILHYLMPGGTWAVTEYMDHNDQNRRKWGLDLKGTPIILCVSKSLRRTLVDCGLYRQAFGSTSSTNGVYYSTHNDGLRIDSTLLQAAVGYYPMILIPCLTLSDMVFPTFEHSIRYLELNANSFTRGLQWFKKIVYQLNNLQELFILATEVDLEVFPGSGRVMIVNVRLQEHDYPGTKLYDGAYIPPLMQIDEQMGNRFRDVVQDIGRTLRSILHNIVALSSSSSSFIYVGSS